VKSGHYSEKMRLEAIHGLTELFASHPEGLRKQVCLSSHIAHCMECSGVKKVVTTQHRSGYRRCWGGRMVSVNREVVGGQGSRMSCTHAICSSYNPQPQNYS